jgi:hypothetical protein
MVHAGVPVVPARMLVFLWFVLAVPGTSMSDAESLSISMSIYPCVHVGGGGPCVQELCLVLPLCADGLACTYGSDCSIEPPRA